MDPISSLTPEFKGQDLKKKLLECLDIEARHFSEIARTYFEKDHLSEEDKTGLLHAIITTVDHVLEGGDWQSSLFLRNTIKPLLAIKAEAEAELAQLEMKAVESAVVNQPLSEDEVEVYISLFQSDGYNMSKWAMQLRSLDRYVVGRPIYKNQDDVEKRIRLRAGLGNEGFVIVVVKKNDIQPAGNTAPLKDQFDHTLLTLKETAIKNGRIIAFVHGGTRYYFTDGQLIKQG